MATIDDINFGELYREHIQAIDRQPKQASDWDNRAGSMTQTHGKSDDPYVAAFIEKMQLKGQKTLLDIGCGPGTICLAVADQLEKVYGLDYSCGMLDAMQQRAEKFGITNAQCIHKSWNDPDWGDVPECDIVVASRATMVSDIEDAIHKMNSKAKHYVYTTHTVDRHFIADSVLECVGRQSSGFPSYIYTVNILNQLGYRPYVDYIDTSLGKKQPSNFESFLKSVVWSIGELTGEEVEKLKSYFNDRQSKGLPVTRTSRAWALVWWSVSR